MLCCLSVLISGRNLEEGWRIDVRGIIFSPSGETWIGIVKNTLHNGTREYDNHHTQLCCGLKPVLQHQDILITTLALWNKSKKGLDSWLSLVSYGNPQTGMLDVRPTCVKQRNAQQRNMIGGKETCTFNAEVTNSDEAIWRIDVPSPYPPIQGRLETHLWRVHSSGGMQGYGKRSAPLCLDIEPVS